MAFDRCQMLQVAPGGESKVGRALFVHDRGFLCPPSRPPSSLPLPYKAPVWEIRHSSMKNCMSRLASTHPH